MSLIEARGFLALFFEPLAGLGLFFAMVWYS
jgi:hypothetical protein